MTTLAAYLDPTDVTTAVGNLLGLRPYLGISGSDEDAHLVSWYAVAIQWCHEKLSRRDFTLADGFEGSVPPAMAVMGVYEFVRVLRDYAARASTVARKIKTGAREEEYDIPGMADRLSAAAIAAWPYIEPYCEDPSLFASGGA